MSALPKKRAEETRSTADRLLAGAADLFRRKGYSATTTRELSALLGIQNASLYYHMETKEDLLYKLCIATLGDVAAVFASCAEEASTPLERLKLIAHRYTTTALRDRDRHATMLMEIRALSEDHRKAVIDMRDRNLAVVRRTMAEAQRSGSVRHDIPAKYLTLMLFNLLNWSIFWYRPDGALTPDELADMASLILLDGIVERPTGRRKGSSARASLSPKIPARASRRPGATSRSRATARAK